MAPITLGWPANSLFPRDFPPAAPSGSTTAESGSDSSALGLRSVSDYAVPLANESEADAANSMQYTLIEKFDLLEIDKCFRDTATYTLFDYYARWVACQSALSKYANHLNDHTWFKAKLTKVEITNLLIKKSMYHKLHPIFSKIVKSPKFAVMKKWLQSKGAEGSADEIWDETKEVYTVTDLTQWIESNKSQVKKGKGKGKGKDIGKKTGSHKKASSSKK